jgi:cysteine protease ATG4
LGGKPGASTYIVGVQEDKGFYLDPHDVQQVFLITPYKSLF